MVQRELNERVRAMEREVRVDAPLQAALSLKHAELSRREQEIDRLSVRLREEAVQGTGVSQTEHDELTDEIVRATVRSTALRGIPAHSTHAFARQLGHGRTRNLNPCAGVSNACLRSETTHHAKRDRPPASNHTHPRANHRPLATHNLAVFRCVLRRTFCT